MSFCSPSRLTELAPPLALNPGNAREVYSAIMPVRRDYFDPTGLGRAYGHSGRWLMRRSIGNDAMVYRD